MQSNRHFKKGFSKLRQYEVREVLSFISFEEFILGRSLINKKSLHYFKENYKKMILNYINSKQSNLSKINRNEEKKEQQEFNNFQENFIKKLLIDLSDKDNTNENIINEKSDIILKKDNFCNFLKDSIFKRFIQFAAYYNEGGFYGNSQSYHYQNMFDYNYLWFCSSLSGKAFNIYATVYYDKTHSDAPMAFDSPTSLNNDLLKKENIENKNSEINENLIELKNLIDESFNFNKYHCNYNKGIIYTNADTKVRCFPDTCQKKENEKFSTSGINKFFLPSLKNMNFFKDIFLINSNWFYNLDSFTIDNNYYGYTCPIKTFAVYIHDNK